MWAKVESNTITQLIHRPKAILVGDIQHPHNIFNLWSEAELKAIGIYSVTVDNTNRKDNEWYKNTDITYTYNSGADTVTGAYGTATAKDLDDTLWTQADSDAGLLPEEKSVGDSKGNGLKTLEKNTINDRAGNLLQKYDWYTLRAARGGTAIPSAVSTYQTAVTTKSNEHQVAIDAVSTVDALAALTFDWPDEPTL